MVAPYVGDVSLFLWNAIKDGKQILLEGQLGSLKDPDHGIYQWLHHLHTGCIWCDRCRNPAI